MKSDMISHRYAKAMLAIGHQTDQADNVGEQLAQITSLFDSSSDLRTTLENPTHARTKRKAIVKQLASRLQLLAAVRNLLLLLIDRNRIEMLRDVARDYQALADEAAQRVRADICSARALDPADLSRIRETLERMTGRKVLLSTRVDPNLIGGSVTTLGSVVYDGSIQGRLNLLRSELTRRRP